MKLSSQVKGISYLKAHAAEIVRDLARQQEPLVISQNGEAKLSESPERGAYPKELLALGIRKYREIFFKSCRIIYQVMGNNVHVLLIADGRRDMETLLHSTFGSVSTRVGHPTRRKGGREGAGQYQFHSGYMTPKRAGHLELWHIGPEENHMGDATQFHEET